MLQVIIVLLVIWGVVKFVIYAFKNGTFFTVGKAIVGLLCGIMFLGCIAGVIVIPFAIWGAFFSGAFEGVITIVQLLVVLAVDIFAIIVFGFIGKKLSSLVDYFDKKAFECWHSSHYARGYSGSGETLFDGQYSSYGGRTTEHDEFMEQANDLYGAAMEARITRVYGPDRIGYDPEKRQPWEDGEGGSDPDSDESWRDAE